MAAILRLIIGERRNSRLAAWGDLSDLVRETRLEALGRLPAYVDERLIASSPRLKQIAWNRLIDLLLPAHYSGAGRYVADEFAIASAGVPRFIWEKWLFNASRDAPWNLTLSDRAASELPA